jgi:electron transport complex protein RnfB
MSVTGIIIATLVVGITGILCGILLGAASEKFKVEVDEKEVDIRTALPGNNCGACGFPGCDGCAHAIATGAAPVNQCPVGGQPVAEKIAAILGVKAEEKEKMVAFVRCSGSCDKVKQRYVYYGPADCVQMSVIPGTGDKACEYGCLGHGSCVRACKFDAIHVVDGISVVDPEKCVACGKCVATCPRHLIELVSYKSKYRVRCSSQDKGKTVREKCAAGCIACTLCTKQCESDAIHMNGNVAQVDYTKCINCGKCAAKCPAKVIN